MKIGIIGVGRAGIRHLRNAQALGHEVVWYDHQVSIPEATSGQRKTSTAVMKEADAVIVATPTEHHLTGLCAAINARKPVLVEKPIAGIKETGRARQLVMAAEERGVPIAVGYNLRYHRCIPPLLQIKNPYFLMLICAQHTDHMADGVLNHWATHEIDLAEYLVGPLRLWHFHVQDRTADLYFVSWETNARVVIHSDMVSHDHFRRITVLSATASINMDLEAEPVIDEDYKAMLADFLTWAQTGNKPSRLADGEDGLTALKHCQRASTLNVQRDQ